MSSRKAQNYWKSRGGGRGSNSKKTAPDLEISSSLGPITPLPDISFAPHNADSPQHAEGDLTDPPIVSSLEAIGGHETVQRLISQLTTPSTVNNKPIVGFAPINEYVDTLINDEDSDDDGADIDPGIESVKIKPLDTRPDKVPPSINPRVHPRPKTKPRLNRRVSEEQSQVDSAELLWFNTIYDATFNTSPSGVIFAIIPITLSTGLSLRPGDSIPADAAELYVQHVQDTTQHSRRQQMLSSFIAPVSKVQKIGEDTIVALSHCFNEGSPNILLEV